MRHSRGEFKAVRCNEWLKRLRWYTQRYFLVAMTEINVVQDLEPAVLVSYCSELGTGNWCLTASRFTERKLAVNVYLSERIFGTRSATRAHDEAGSEYALSVSTGFETIFQKNARCLLEKAWSFTRFGRASATKSVLKVEILGWKNWRKRRAKYFFMFGKNLFKSCHVLFRKAAT